MKACLVGKSGESGVFGTEGTNIYLGEEALSNNTGMLNTALGYMAMSNSTTGSCNTALSYMAMSNNTTGSGNTALGYMAMSNNTTGIFNTATGYAAMLNNTTGNGNTALGYMAGSIGMSTSATQKSIYIGCNAGFGDANSTNEIVIGADTTGGGSDTVTLGNNAITKLRCQVTTITALSDKRLKEEIEPADLKKCLEAVKKLPVTRYKYKNFTGTHVDKNVTGFMADDVEKVFPKAVSKTDQYFPVLDEKGNQVYEEVDGVKVAKTFLMEDVKDITMTEALPTLWGAVQALAKEVESLRAELKKYKK